jgi:predicted RNase H-like nuclease (RuvC/YqgF family)
MMIKQGRDESMQDTVDAIAQLATATALDRGTVATLTKTNVKLATQLEADHAQITQLKNKTATLKNKIKPAWQEQRPVKTTNNDSHCWSHGYQVAKSHTKKMQHEKERTSGCSEQEQHHGRSPMGQGMMPRGS